MKTTKNKPKRTESRYHEIALMVAQRIVDGKYPLGEKIRSRTTIASNFGVSPETARKAVNLLADLEIVEVIHGSGVYVRSKEKASAFIARSQNLKQLTQTKQELRESIKRQQEELQTTLELIGKLETESRRTQDSLTLVPFELVVTEAFKELGQTVGQLNLWHRTKATIMAVKRGEEMILSPGPVLMIEVGDIVYYIGDDQAKQMMELLFTGETGKEGLA